MAYFTTEYTSLVLRQMARCFIYFPDDIDKENCKVITFLHGFSATYTDCIARLNILPMADKYGFAVIMPDGGNTMFLNTSYGEKHFDSVTELITLAQKWFNFSSDKSNNIVAGYSGGGYAALRMGYLNKGMFSKILSISSPTNLDNCFFHMLEGKNVDWMRPITEANFGKINTTLGTEYDLNYIVKSADKDIQTILYCGDKDNYLADTKVFYDSLKAKKLPSELNIINGKHDYTTWRQCFEDFCVKSFEPVHK